MAILRFFRLNSQNFLALSRESFNTKMFLSSVRAKKVDFLQLKSFSIQNAYKKVRILEGNF